MPRHVDRPLPPASKLRERLAAAGATDVPSEGDPFALQGMLWMAGYLSERQKKIAFPGFSWRDARFQAKDGKVAVDVAYVPVASRASLHEDLRAATPRARGLTLLGLDARASGMREYELVHALFGQVTLFSWPAKPVEPMDRRVHEAVDRGWSPTLKSHNLLPGRGIVVLDEHHGLVFEKELSAIPGFLALLSGGDTHLWWNPLCETSDPEMQHYLAWGAGLGQASEWREVLHYEGDDVS